MKLYSNKKIEEIKNAIFNDGFKKGKFESELNLNQKIDEVIKSYEEKIHSKDIDIESLRTNVNDAGVALKKLAVEVKALENKNNILKTFIILEADKKIKRLECIAKRTKKARIKKKCETKIQDYEMRILAYEK